MELFSAPYATTKPSSNIPWRKYQQGPFRLDQISDHRLQDPPVVLVSFARERLFLYQESLGRWGGEYPILCEMEFCVRWFQGINAHVVLRLDAMGLWYRSRWRGAGRPLPGMVRAARAEIDASLSHAPQSYTSFCAGAKQTKNCHPEHHTGAIHTAPVKILPKTSGIFRPFFWCPFSGNRFLYNEMGELYVYSAGNKKHGRNHFSQPHKSTILATAWYQRWTNNCQGEVAQALQIR